jgi:hypothetical protein
MLSGLQNETTRRSPMTQTKAARQVVSDYGTRSEPADRKIGRQPLGVVERLFIHNERAARIGQHFLRRLHRDVVPQAAE